MKLPLTESTTTQFVDDGNGGTIAVAYLSPNVFGATWNVRRVTINSDSVGSSRFYLYMNAITPSALIDGSYSGNQDTDEISGGYVLQTLDKLVCVWVNGDMDANCTVTITGDKETGRI